MQDRAKLLENLKLAHSARGINEKLKPENELQAKRLTHIPAQSQQLFLRVWNQADSRQEAVKAMCIMCFGYDKTGVGECGDRLCPLWHYRPFQPGVEESEVEVVDAGSGDPQ